MDSENARFVMRSSTLMMKLRIVDLVNQDVKLVNRMMNSFAQLLLLISSQMVLMLLRILHSAQPIMSLNTSFMLINSLIVQCVLIISSLIKRRNHVFLAQKRLQTVDIVMSTVNVLSVVTVFI